MTNPADRIIIDREVKDGTHLLEMLWPGGRVRLRFRPDGGIVRADVTEGPAGFERALLDDSPPEGAGRTGYCPYIGPLSWEEHTVWAFRQRVLFLWRQLGMPGGRVRCEETHPEGSRPVFAGFDNDPNAIY